MFSKVTINNNFMGYLVISFHPALLMMKISKMTTMKIIEVYVATLVVEDEKVEEFFEVFFLEIKST